MTNLRAEICFAIKKARREAKLSQSVVAAEVGCTQSALSMFEQGDGTKLNEEVIEKLATKFKVSLDAPKDAADETKAPLPFDIPLGSDVLVKAQGYCPNPHCPSNHPFVVEGKTFYLPDRDAADPVGGRFCALCGEVLERKCPNCGAPVHKGAVCSLCGERYITT